MYGYNSYNSERQVYLPPNGIEIDPEKNILLINVCKKKGYVDWETVSHEFPLLQYSTCTECNSVVSVYALGSVAFLESAYKAQLFTEPWHNNSMWKLIQLDGAFALVANAGHNFELDRHKSLEAQCHCKERRLAS